MSTRRFGVCGCCLFFWLLSLPWVAARPTVDSETNNSLATADLFPLTTYHQTPGFQTGSVFGRLLGENDSDFWQISVLEGTGLAISLNTLYNDFRLGVAIYDAAGNELARAVGGGPDGNLYDDTWRAPADGAYYVAVTRNGTTRDHYYQLHLVAAAAVESDRDSANNTLPGATPLVWETQTGRRTSHVAGMITDPRGIDPDQDVFALGAFSATEQLHIVTTAPLTGALTRHLRLFGVAGNLLVEGTNSLSYAVNNTGPLFVQVTGGNEQIPQPYPFPGNTAYQLRAVATVNAPLQLLSRETLPEPGQTIPHIFNTFTLVFSEPPKLPLPGVAVSIIGAGGDAFDNGNDRFFNPYLLRSDGNRLLFQIASGPLPPDRYRVTVLDGITDSAGEAFDGDGDGVPGGNYRFEFTIEPDEAVTFAGRSSEIPVTMTIVPDPIDENFMKLDKPILGVVDPANTINKYRFLGVPGDTWSFWLEEGNPSDISFGLYTDTGQPLYVTGHREGPSQSAYYNGYTLPYFGDYEIRIGTHIDVPGCYKLHLAGTRGIAHEQDRSKENNIRWRAQSIPLERIGVIRRGRIAGHILEPDNWEPDIDYYQIGRHFPGTFVRLETQRGPNPSRQTRVSLVDENDQVVAVGDGDVLQHTFTATGTYWAKVEGATYADFGIDARYLLDVVTRDLSPPKVVDSSLPHADQPGLTLIETFVVYFNEGVLIDGEDPAANASLIGAGADGIFGNGDDTTYLLTFDTSTLAQLTCTLEDGPLASGRYRLEITNRVTDFLDNPLDGDGDGVGGDNYVHEFSINLPEEGVFEGRANRDLGSAALLTMSVDPQGGRHLRTVSHGYGTIAVDDVDYWRLNLFAGDTLVFYVDPMASNATPSVTLYNATGTQLATSARQNNRGGGSVVGPYTLTSDGTYYLGVTAVAGPPGDYQVHAQAVRGIEIETDNLNAGTNENPATANFVVFQANGKNKQAVVAGTLAQSAAFFQDRDTYQLGELSAGDGLSMSLTVPSTGSLEARISVIDADGVPLADQDGDPEDNHFSTTIPSAGRYYAQITHAPRWADRGRAYQVASATDFAAAADEATALGGHLVTVSDGPEQLFLWRYLARATAVSLGLNDQNNDGVFTWQNGENPAFDFWARQRPLPEGTSWVALDSGDGFWRDSSTPEAPFIIETADQSGRDRIAPGADAQYVLTIMVGDQIPPTITAMTGLPAPDDPVRVPPAFFTVQFSESLDPLTFTDAPDMLVIDDTLYLVSPATMTRTAAGTWAGRAGGRLATILDADHQHQINAYFGFDNLWLGLNDNDGDGQYVWEDVDSSYRNFAGDFNNAPWVYLDAVSGLWRGADNSGTARALVAITVDAVSDGDNDGIPDGVDPFPSQIGAPWTLVQAGPDDVFDTEDDQSFTVVVAAANSNRDTLTLFIRDNPLPGGHYRLRLHPLLRDPAGNPLDGDGDGQAGGVFTTKFDVVTTHPDYVWEGPRNFNRAGAVPLNLIPVAGTNTLLVTERHGWGTIQVDDADWFSFHAEAGDIASIEAFTQAGRVDAGLTIQLYDADGAYKFGEQTTTVTRKPHISGYPIAESGTYYVKIQYNGNAANYQLHVELARGINMEVDNFLNNRLQGANPVQYNGHNSQRLAALTGTLGIFGGYPSDIDYVNLGDLLTGQRITISMMLVNAATTAAYLFVSDAAGNVLADSNGETFTVTIPADGVFYLGITHQPFLVSQGRRYSFSPRITFNALLVSGLPPSVIVNSEEEHHWLLNTMLSGGSGTIGLVDMENDGTYEWRDGTPVTFTNWEPGQPNYPNPSIALVNGRTSLWAARGNHVSYTHLLEEADPQNRDLVCPGPHAQYVVSIAIDDNEPPRLTGTRRIPERDGTTHSPPASFELYFSEVLAANSLGPLGTPLPPTWSLRHAGDDDVFDTGDDRLYDFLISEVEPNPRMLTFQIVDGPLAGGRYRLQVPATVTDLGANPLDGDGDGVGGDALIYPFSVSLPDDVVLEGPNNDTSDGAIELTLREDPIGDGYFQSITDGFGSIDPADDRDTWSFVATAGSQLAAWVIPQEPDTRLKLYLYGPDGRYQRLEEEGAANPFGVNLAPYISAAMLSDSGRYTLVVANSPRSDFGGTYRIYLETFQGAMESDHNNSNWSFYSANRLDFEPYGLGHLARIAGKIMAPLTNRADRDSYRLGIQSAGTTVLVAGKRPTHSTLSMKVTVSTTNGGEHSRRQGPNDMAARYDFPDEETTYAAIQGLGGAGARATYLLDVLLWPTDALDYVDLAASAVQVPEQASNGQTIPIQWRSGNYGVTDLTSAAHADYLVLSQDELLGNQDDRLVAQVPHTGPLAAGEVVARQANLPLPPDMSGPLWLFVVADGANQIDELIFDNNNAAQAPWPIQVEPGENAQLRVDNLVTPAMVEPGTDLNISWQMHNLGGFDAPASVDTVLITPAANPTLELFRATLAAPPLARGASTTRNATLSLPFALRGSGELLVSVHCDATLLIDETDETDNTVARGISVPALLQIIQVPTSLHEGESVIVRAVRSGANDQPLVAQISTQPAGTLTAPSEVTFAADRSYAEFPLTAPDNQLPNGPISAGVTMTAAGYAEAQAACTVLDGSAAGLWLSLDQTTLAEGESTLMHVNRTGSLAQSQTVYLRARPEPRLILADSLTLGAGQASASVPVSLVDDHQVDAAAAAAHISATAAGLVPGAIDLTLVDNDTPVLSLTPMQDALDEGASQPLTLQLMRNNGAGPLRIAVTADPAEAVSLPAEVRFADQQTSLAIALYPVDNSVNDGARTIQVRATALSNDRRVPIPASTASASFLLHDNDQEHLQISLEQTMAAPGQRFAATLTRVGALDRSRRVALSLSADDFATVTETVVLPIGVRTTSFAVTTNAQAPPDDQWLTVTATTEGLSPVNARFLLTARPRPNLIIDNVFYPAEVAAGAPFTLGYRLRNTGLAPARALDADGHIGAWRDRILFSNDRFEGDDLSGAEPQYSSVIEPGAVLERTVRVTAPKALGSFYALIFTDTHNQVIEHDENDNSHFSRNPFTTTAPYDVTITADRDHLAAGQQVLLQGEVRNGADALVPNAEVEVLVVNGDWRRMFRPYSDATGRFTLPFRAPQGETGTFSVAAGYPGAVGTPQTEFTLRGVTLTAPNPMLLAQNSRRVFDLELVNLGPLPIENLVVAVDAPTGVTAEAVFTAGNRLAGAGSLPLQLTLTANAAPYNLPINLMFHGDNGFSQEQRVTATLGRDQGLTAEPGFLAASLTPGSTRLLQVPLVNRGATPTPTLTLIAPDNPNLAASAKMAEALGLQWASPSNLPALAPAAVKPIGLWAAPPADLPSGHYRGNLQVAAGNQVLQIPFDFLVTQAENADLSLTLVDETTFIDEPNSALAGAEVVLHDPLSGETLAGATTDQNGAVQFNQIPAGWVQVVIHAADHEPTQHLLYLEAGAEAHRQVFVSQRLVSRDQVISATDSGFQLAAQDRVTDGVSPALVFSPNTLALDALTEIGDQLELTLTLTNRGSADAETLTLLLPEHPQFTLTTPTTDLGDLPAQSSLALPLRIQRHADDGDAAPAPFPLLLQHHYQAGPHRIVKTRDLPLYNVAAFDAAAMISPLQAWENYQATVATLINSAGRAPNMPAPGPQDPGCPTCRLATPDTALPHYQFSTHNLEMRWREQMRDALGGCTPAPALLACSARVFACSGTTPIEADAAADCANLAACFGNHIAKQAPSIAETVVGCAERVLALGDQWPGAVPAGAGSDIAAKQAPFQTQFDQIRGRLLWVESRLDLWRVFLGDETMVNDATGIAFAHFFAAWSQLTAPSSEAGRTLSEAEQNILHAMAPPEGVSAAAVSALAARWNRTLDYYTNGIFTRAALPNGWDADFLDRDDLAAAASRAEQAVTDARTAGFDDPGQALAAALAALANDLAAEAETAKPGFQLRAEPARATHTRPLQVTLTVENPDNQAWQELDAAFHLLDGQGTPVDAAFSIGSVQTTGISPDGTLAGGAVGHMRVAVRPLNPTTGNFLMAASLTYQRDGVSQREAFEPIPLTFYQPANLAVNLYHEREFHGGQATRPTQVGLRFQYAGAGGPASARVGNLTATAVTNQTQTPALFAIDDARADGEDLATAELDLAAGRQHHLLWSLNHGEPAHLIAFLPQLRVQSLSDGAALVNPAAVQIFPIVKAVQAPELHDDTHADFLVDADVDAGNWPESLHLSDGRVLPLAVVDQAQVRHFVGKNEQVIALNVADAEGPFYLRIDDPAGPDHHLHAVQDRDGRTLPIGVNVWQSALRLTTPEQQPDSRPQLHLFDSHNGSPYTLRFRHTAQPEPAVAQFEPFESPTARARDTVIFSFTAEIDAGSFAADDVRLRHNGETRFPAEMQIQVLGPRRFQLSGLAAVTADDGVYQLDIDCSGINNLADQPGSEIFSIEWIKSASAPAVSQINGIAANWVNQPLDAVTVVFTHPLAAGSFDAEDLTFTRDQTPLSWTPVIAAVSGTEFEITGLAAAMSADGAYRLVINASGVRGSDEAIGIGGGEVMWQLDRQPPQLSVRGLPGGADPVTGTWWLAFDEPLADDSQLATLLTLTYEDGPNLLTDLAPLQPVAGGYRLDGLTPLLQQRGGVYRLTVTTTALADRAGNHPAEDFTATWLFTADPPPPPFDLTITPNQGDATLARSNRATLVVAGAVAADVAHIAIWDQTTETLLAVATPEPDGRFARTVVLAGDGLHALRVEAHHDRLQAAALLPVLLDRTNPIVRTTSHQPANGNDPVDAIVWQFNEALSAVVNAPALSLQRNGETVTLPPNLSFSLPSAELLRVEGLAAATARAGRYQISLNLDSVTDLSANPGLGRTTYEWTQRNRPPALTAVAAQSLVAGQMLTLALEANDPDDDALLFSLDAGAPTEAVIGPGDGVFSWRPPPTSPAGVYAVRVRVTDNGDPAQSTTTAFEVTVSAAPLVRLTIEREPVQAGTVTGAGRYPGGTTAVVQAFAYPNFRFEHWQGAAVSNPEAASTSVTLDQDQTVTAVFSSTATVLSFLDPAFEAALLAGYDADQNGVIDSMEASLITVLDLSGQAITDLEGLNHFTQLHTLDVSFNQLDSLPTALPTTLSSLNLAHNRFSQVPSLWEHPSLGDDPTHHLHIDHNLFEDDDCGDLAQLRARFAASGASFTYEPAGNFSLMAPQWLTWPSGFSLLALVDAVNTETPFTYPLECP